MKHLTTHHEENTIENFKGTRVASLGWWPEKCICQYK